MLMGCFGTNTVKDDGGNKTQAVRNKEIEKQLTKDKQHYKTTHRLLLLGKILREPLNYAVNKVKCVSIL